MCVCVYVCIDIYICMHLVVANIIQHSSDGKLFGAVAVLFGGPGDFDPKA